MSTTAKENEESNTNGDIKVISGDDDFKVSAWGERHLQCLILFVSLTVAYSLRACMSVALVAMIKEVKTNATLIYNNTDNAIKNYTVENVDISNEYEEEDEWVPDGILNALMLVPPYPKFKWDTKTQNIILSSFFWGYTLLQIPSGYLAHRFGARFMLTGAMFINCVLSICLPWLAYYGGWVCTVLCRAMQGLGQACIIPGLHTFFGKWTPLHERGRLTAITYGGQALGPVLGFPLTGFIAASPMGWPGIFRFYGVLSGLVGALIWWKCADTPAKHPNISIGERQYIEHSLGQTNLKKKVLRVPWSHIFRSPGMYAIIIAHIGNTWGQLTIYTQVPSFMNKVMGVNIKNNGMLSALPFLAMFFSNLLFSWITDMLLVKNLLSVTNVRKLATFTGHGFAGLGLTILAFVPKNIYVVEILLVFICSFKIASHLGFHVNHIDISPNFAGPLISISNFSSNLCGSLAPIVAGFILTDDTSEYLWRQVFLIAAGLYAVTVIVYLIFGTGEKADWNEPMDDDDDDKLDKEGQQVPMIHKENAQANRD